MKAEDFIGPPCGCAECRQAGVMQLEQRRDPQSGAWLHGYDLKRWYAAQERFQEQARGLFTAKSFPTGSSMKAPQEADELAKVGKTEKPKTLGRFAR